MINEDDLIPLSMSGLRSLKFKIERRLHDLEMYYIRLGISAKITDGNNEDTVTTCPYPIGTEEALLWQEGYDKH